jgi:hypothetical protein
MNEPPKKLPQVMYVRPSGPMVTHGYSATVWPWLRTIGDVHDVRSAEQRTALMTPDSSLPSALNSPSSP